MDKPPFKSAEEAAETLVNAVVANLAVSGMILDTASRTLEIAEQQLYENRVFHAELLALCDKCKHNEGSQL